MKAAAPTQAPVSLGPPQYDPYDYRIHEDPYPTYARLRAEAPVYRNEELDFFALALHRDVLAAFRDVDRFSNACGVSLDPTAFGPHAHRSMSFLAMDPPTHTRLRSLVNKSFTVRRVAELEERIRAIAIGHLLVALEKESFDFITDVAGLLPMDVISELIGVPKEDRGELRRLADVVVHREEGRNDVPPEGAEAALFLGSYFADLVAARRRDGDRGEEDLSAALLGADLGGDRLSDDEIVSILFLMVVAGNETTTKLLGNAWYWGWRHPDQGTLPFSDPTRIPSWIEETLRYDGSTQMLVRVARVGVEVGDTSIPAGAKVLLLVGSGNRDASVFPDADRYDISRDTQGMLSFGGGRHFCMGAPLARMEARVALEELVARVRSYDVNDDAAVRVHSVNVRGFASLPTSVVCR